MLGNICIKKEEEDDFFDHDEFDEQSDSKEQALSVLHEKYQEYARGDESMGVLDAYQRAAMKKGASICETELVMRKEKGSIDVSGMKGEIVGLYKEPEGPYMFRIKLDNGNITDIGRGYISVSDEFSKMSVKDMDKVLSQPFHGHKVGDRVKISSEEPHYSNVY